MYFLRFVLWYGNLLQGIGIVWTIVMVGMVRIVKIGIFRGNILTKHIFLSLQSQLCQTQQRQLEHTQWLCISCLCATKFVNVNTCTREDLVHFGEKLSNISVTSHQCQVKVYQHSFTLHLNTFLPIVYIVYFMSIFGI